ncbi:hypothetical protein HDU99_010977 [Rhizoclosmatium hyalinum]|nr:hypothetical protein HDU99_010977 [Rhizoclosmatium hyalinum]
MPDAPTKKRILCLHGLRTNTTVMEFQITGLKLALGSEVEFISVNAPMTVDADPEIVAVFGDAGPWYAWYRLALFGKYEGLDRSIRFVEDVIARNGPFDAILGFSQGALMATILTARMQNTIQDPEKYLWRGVILACGPSINDKGKATYNFKKLQFPSIHIAGKEDKAYKASLELTELYDGKDRYLFEHSGGHQFPSPFVKNPIYDEISAAIRKMIH